MNRIFKTGLILQIIYYILCVASIIIIVLHRIFYYNDFGKISFEIGTLLNMFTLLNPLGIIGIIVSIIGYFSTNGKRSKRATVYLALSPVITITLWYFTCCIFVYCTGGV